MDKDKITPEEKLLKIIENPAKEKPKTETKTQAKQAPLKKEDNWRNRIRINKNVFKQIPLLAVNRAVFIFCGVLTVFLFLDFVRLNKNLYQRYERVIKGESVSDTQEGKSSVFAVEINEVLSLAKKRNIFSLTLTKPQIAADQDLAQFVNNLKLVGVMWSNNPQAIIENIKEGKTYLLNIGEKIGQLEIRKILRDKIILGKEEQEWELR